MAAGGFIISLDFELMWGVHDVTTQESYGRNILGAREAIPQMLDLFAENGIGCTWATVGLLFCENRDEMIAATPDHRPDYENTALSPYPLISGIGRDEKSDPYHYAPSLIDRIAGLENQEIATHTFSHYFCLEKGQTLADFEADLDAAIAVAARRSIKLQSIVFPRNQFNPVYLQACFRRGITTYRGTEKAWMYNPRARSDQNGMHRGGRLADSYFNLTGANSFVPILDGQGVNVPASRYLRPHSNLLARLESLRLSRITRAMHHAASRGETYHLWFHPHDFGGDIDTNMAFLRKIIACFVKLRSEYGWQSQNMSQAAHQCSKAVAA